MNARYYRSYIYRMLTPDVIVPDAANPQSYNRYTYGLNNPVRYFDPTGHYTCTSNIEGYSDEECHEDIDDLLNALETEGGDLGAELVSHFHFLDNGGCVNALWRGPSCATDSIQIVIDGSAAQAIPLLNVLVIGWDLIEMAHQGGEEFLIAAGVLGHELKHFQQGVARVGSLHAEAEGYKVQYDLFVAMGLNPDDPNENRNYIVGVATLALLVDVSDYELMNSPLASAYGFPLYGGPYWVVDNQLRDFAQWRHDVIQPAWQGIQDSVSNWWNDIWN